MRKARLKYSLANSSTFTLCFLNGLHTGERWRPPRKIFCTEERTRDRLQLLEVETGVRVLCAFIHKNKKQTDGVAETLCHSLESLKYLTALSIALCPHAYTSYVLLTVT